MPLQCDCILRNPFREMSGFSAFACPEMEWSSNHSDWSHMWLAVLRNMYVAPCERDRGSAPSLPEPAALQDFGAHQQRKYFSCKEITWSPRLETRIFFFFKKQLCWNEVCVLASFDIFLKFLLLAGTEPPNVWAYLREMLESEERALRPPHPLTHIHIQPPSSLAQINPVVCLLIQPVKGWVMHYWIKSPSKPFTFQSTGLVPLCWHTHRRDITSYKSARVVFLLLRAIWTQVNSQTQRPCARTHWGHRGYAPDHCVCGEMALAPLLNFLKATPLFSPAAFVDARLRGR